MATTSHTRWLCCVFLLPLLCPCLSPAQHSRFRTKLPSGHAEHEVEVVRRAFGWEGGGNDNDDDDDDDERGKKKNKRWNSSPQGGRGKAPDYSREIADRLTPEHLRFIHSFYAEDLWSWKGCKDHNQRPFVKTGPRGEIAALK